MWHRSFLCDRDRVQVWLRSRPNREPCLHWLGGLDSLERRSPRLRICRYVEKTEWRDHLEHWLENGNSVEWICNYLKNSMLLDKFFIYMPHEVWRRLKLLKGKSPKFAMWLGKIIKVWISMQNNNKGLWKRIKTSRMVKRQARNRRLALLSYVLFFRWDVVQWKVI